MADQDHFVTRAVRHKKFSTARAAPSRTKINTKPAQAASGPASRRPAGRGGRRAGGRDDPRPESLRSQGQAADAVESPDHAISRRLPGTLRQATTKPAMGTFGDSWRCVHIREPLSKTAKTSYRGHRNVLGHHRRNPLLHTHRHSWRYVAQEGALGDIHHRDLLALLLAHRRADAFAEARLQGEPDPRGAAWRASTDAGPYRQRCPAGWPHASPAADDPGRHDPG